MEESFNNLSPTDDTSMSTEFNNNNHVKWKRHVQAGITAAAFTPCNVPVQIAGNPSDNSDFEIVNIDPCYVTAISSYKYETFKLATARVTRGACEQGRLAQMRANTKLKRTRKPYQLPNRCPVTASMLHSRATSVINGEQESTGLEMRSPGLNRSQSNRVMSLVDDRLVSRKAPSDVFRSRSLEDLRSLAKTTTVMFNSMHCKQDGELDEVSKDLSNLCVNDDSPS